MNGQRLIVVWSLAAVALMVGLRGNPVTFLVVFGFLVCCPGIVVSGQLALEDRAVTAMLLVASSLAVDALVAETLVYTRLFTGTRTVVALAAIAVAGALLRRPVAAPSGSLLPARRGAGSRRQQPDLDRALPALLVRIGRYPVYHGSVSAIRSLGRGGVPVHAIVEDRLTPAAASRYLEGAHVWPTSGAEPEEFLVEGLRRIGEALGTRTLAIPTDDEAAVLLAEHGAELREHFVYPDVDPRLPRRLASKEGLHILCGGYGVPQPDAYFPRSEHDIYAYAADATFPVVVKNVNPFDRLRSRAVGGTTVVRDARELLKLAQSFPSPESVMFQEYIPRADAEDWIFQTYCDGESNARVPFTGIKLRSWPPHAGVTTYARAARNEELEALSVDFCRNIAYRGVCDLDWRFDRRDGKYKLVDFNPRPGAQFALFETEAGIDVVRALHLDLSGRPVPSAPARASAIRVEHLDVPSAIAYRGGHEPAPSDVRTHGHAHPVWLAPDDPVPFFVMLARVFGPALRRVSRRRATQPSVLPETAPLPVYASAGADGTTRPSRTPRRRLVITLASAAAILAVGALVLRNRGATAPPHTATAVALTRLTPVDVTLSITSGQGGGPVRVVATQPSGRSSVLLATGALRAGQTLRVVVPFPTRPTTVTVSGLDPGLPARHLELDPSALAADLGIRCPAAPGHAARSAACAWLGS